MTNDLNVRPDAGPQSGIPGAQSAVEGHTGLRQAQPEREFQVHTHRISTPMLEIADLHGYYGKSHVLHGVNLHVNAGEIVCLLGLSLIHI